VKAKSRSEWEKEPGKIAAAPFTMGTDSSDPNEAPAHEVDLPVFMIDKLEVTNADFVFVEATGHETYAEKQGSTAWRAAYTEGKDNHPVVYVAFDDAMAYCTYSPDLRGLRGGGWFDDEGQVRATNRNAGDPTITANDDIGFRCAK
jgi:formylglycine-generating enzyme required for sulfatase activity